MTRWRLASLLGILLVVSAMAFLDQGRFMNYYGDRIQRQKDRRTVSDRLAEFGPAARKRLTPFFRGNGVPTRLLPSR